jgi:hypothetical protein
VPFLTGAFANSIAVALLYPLILAKTRLQSAKSRRSAPKVLLPHVQNSAASSVDHPRPHEHETDVPEIRDSDTNLVGEAVDDVQTRLEEAVHEVKHTVTNAVGEVKEKLDEVREGVRDKGYQVLGIWRDAYNTDGEHLRFVLLSFS